MEVNMKYKVHWLIDGVIEIEAGNIEFAEKTGIDYQNSSIKNQMKYTIFCKVEILEAAS